MNREDIQIIRLGKEKQPLVILDNFAFEPEALVADAATKTFKKDGSYYPGIRAKAGFNYLSERGPLIVKIFKEIFNCSVGIEVTESNYSMVAKPEETLDPIQSLPHFDGFNPQNFAILHYLCREDQGGTAFYRHKATGFETITEDRFSTYEASLKAEAKEDGIPKGYFRGSDRFERIYEIEPLFNRLVIYRGILLHSGSMPANPVFSDDPAVGRLTLNIFASGRSG